MRNYNKQFTSEEQIILTTLLYSDIFNFPLTRSEIRKFLVGTMSLNRFSDVLESLQKAGVIIIKDGYYCLRDREAIIAKRKANGSEVTKKLKLAQKAAKLLSGIPTIIFIGISGGLAVSNVTAQDDIDFFIIVKKGSLFVSRFWILVFLEFLGLRRTRKGKQTADMVCVNLLIDESALAWAKDQQDLYVAHEIAQVLPVFEREGMYERFLQQNTWVNSFLPYAFTEKTKPMQYHTKQIGRFISKLMIVAPFEVFFRGFQKKLIRRNQTKEIVTDTHLGFHPNDYKTQTLDQLRLKMRQLGLLTKL